MDNWVDIGREGGAEWRRARGSLPREGEVEVIALLECRLSLLRFLPSGGGALIVAELFYKFHSFTAECLAFLATWLVFDLVREIAVAAFRPAVGGDPSGPM